MSLLNFVATMSGGIIALLFAASYFADAFAAKGGEHGRVTRR